MNILSDPKTSPYLRSLPSYNLSNSMLDSKWGINTPVPKDTELQDVLATKSSEYSSNSSNSSAYSTSSSYETEDDSYPYPKVAATLETRRDPELTKHVTEKRNIHMRCLAREKAANKAVKKAANKAALDANNKAIKEAAISKFSVAAKAVAPVAPVEPVEPVEPIIEIIQEDTSPTSPSPTSPPSPSNSEADARRIKMLRACPQHPQQTDEEYAELIEYLCTDSSLKLKEMKDQSARLTPHQMAALTKQSKSVACEIPTSRPDSGRSMPEYRRNNAIYIHFSEAEKLEVFNYYEKCGNCSATATKFNLSKYMVKKITDSYTK